ncbi:MAG: permease component [Verrucomicrobia bacterium]|nr:MAG: permease component [Verrucomicrobiota bacterium]
MLALAHNTLLELVRLKVFYFLLLFAFLVIGSSIFTVKFSFQNPLQVLKDIGLGAMSIFSWLLGLLCTAGLLPKDQEDRTLYTILAKPVSRFEYLLGKLSGVFFLLTLAVVLMSVVFAGVLGLREQQEIAAAVQNTPPESLAQEIESIRSAAFQANLLPGILLILLKSLLCSTLTLLLSTIASSSVFTILSSVVIYLIGHVQGIAREAWLGGGETTAVLKVLSASVALVFPDLQLFNVVDEIAVGTALPMALFWQVGGLGLFYILIYFLLAQVVFASREL